MGEIRNWNKFLNPPPATAIQPSTSQVPIYVLNSIDKLLTDFKPL